MLRQIDKSLKQKKASRGGSRGRRSVMTRVLWPALASSMAMVVVVGFASAADPPPPYKLLKWNWKFQKKPMAASLVFCNGPDAPKDPSAPADQKDQPWTKVSDVIKAAAAKWQYKDGDKVKFQFNFAADDCARCPPPNYIDFGKLKDPTKLAETTAPQVAGTDRMKKCTIRFNSAKSWYVGNVSDGNPPAGQYDLFTVALHELGHCVGLDDVDRDPTHPEAVVVMTKYPPADQPLPVLRDLKQGDMDGRKAIYDTAP
jgi:hypothetical protein